MKHSCSLYCFTSSAFLWCLTLASSTQAQQVVRDTTLPNDSVVTPSGKTSVITGGTQSGPNLFHSFKEFSVRDGDTASFQQIDQGTENVISRVTGSLGSNINGLIEVLQTNGTVSSANLFLINPNGIIFGPNASLNIGGSFLASTASSLNFADDTQFSATDPQATPLLTVSAPIGLQFGSNAGSIFEQGSGLVVQPGKTLALMGGDVALEGGNLTAEGGRIELGSVTSGSLVSLNSTDEGWSMGYEGVQSFGDIQLSQGAYVDASGEGGGNIQVQGRRITLTDGSAIGAVTQRSEPGGTLTVTASESVELLGGLVDIEGRFFASALFNEVGKAATGPGGDLIITTKRLIVQDGAEVSVRTSGKGQGGDLTVTGYNSVELIGTSINGLTSSGLFSPTEATGAGGDLTIIAGRLLVEDGAQISTTSFGDEGRAGDLTAKAWEIELTGAALSASGQVLINENGIPIAPSGLFTSTFSRGNGGNLTVESNRLSLRDGAVLQTSTLGAGDAGDLTVRVRESVELIGRAAKDSKIPSGLLAVSGGIPGLPGFPKATGQGGDIDLKVINGQLLIQDGAAIAVSSINQTSAAKGAGNITVAAPTISLDNGDIAATTASGNGGNIEIQVPNLLLLRRDSNISTSAGSEQKGGDGGNITINTNSIIAVPQENSDITANAFSGSGGDVDIEVQGDIFGLEPRSRQELQDLLDPDDPLDPDRLASNDITAISQTNPSLSGDVTINTPDVDPSEGMVALPDVPVNVAVAQGCQATGTKQASVEFFNTGKGGLAPHPYEPLSSNEVWEDMPQGVKNLAGETRASNSPTTPSNKIVEAQGWLVNEKGEAVLVAEVPTARSQRRCYLH